MDEEYCAWKQTLDNKLKSDHGFEKLILDAKIDTGFEMCYVCSGYNYNCPDYVSNYKLNH